MGGGGGRVREVSFSSRQRPATNTRNLSSSETDLVHHRADGLHVRGAQISKQRQEEGRTKPRVLWNEGLMHRELEVKEKCRSRSEGLSLELSNRVGRSRSRSSRLLAEARVDVRIMLSV